MTNTSSGSTAFFAVLIGLVILFIVMAIREYGKRKAKPRSRRGKQNEALLKPDEAGEDEIRRMNPQLLTAIKSNIAKVEMDVYTLRAKHQMETLIRRYERENDHFDEQG